jgi:hypothetical protein
MYPLKMLQVSRAAQQDVRSNYGHCKVKDSTSIDIIDNWCAFGPRKASKVEKPSSRGVSSLHRWSLMLLPVLWLMPLCALCTHVCVSTTLCLLSFASLPHCCCFPELGPMTQIDLSASLLLHLDNMTERTNRIGDLTRHRVS